MTAVDLDSSPRAEATPPGSSSGPGVEEMFSTVAEALRAVAENESMGERLALADTTCALEVDDSELGLTVLFDRQPIEVAEEVSDDAEIRIWGPEAQWSAVLSGKRTLPMALGQGELEWTGPVRKVLRIVPIVRRAYVNVAAGRNPDDDPPPTESEDEQDAAERGSGRDGDDGPSSDARTDDADGSESSGGPGVEEMFSTVAEALRAVAENESMGERLALADTTCALEVDDSELGLTVLFDRQPIEVAEEVSDDAEIRIWGPEEQWSAVLSGKRTLPMALGQGELEWTGPVRKVLRIVPIVRRAYVNVAAGRNPDDDPPAPEPEEED